MSDIKYKLYFDQSVPSWKLEVEIQEGVDAPQHPFVYFGFYYPQDSGLSSSETPTPENKSEAVRESVSNQGYLRIAADDEFSSVVTEDQLGSNILTDYRLRVGLFEDISIPSGSELNDKFDDNQGWDDVPTISVDDSEQYTESGLALPGYIKFRKATLSSNYPTYNLARKALDSVKSRLASLMGKYSSTQAPLSLSIRRISELRGDSTTTCYPGDSLRVEISGGVAGYEITPSGDYSITDQNNIRIIKNTAGAVTLSVQDASGATKSLTLTVILPEDYTSAFVGDSL
tara:strand:+ start:858 stop:1718 length:861 start_codon:yes stop_codon:yes gene_type:complete